MRSFVRNLVLASLAVVVVLGLSSGKSLAKPPKFIRPSTNPQSTSLKNPHAIPYLSQSSTLPKNVLPAVVRKPMSLQVLPIPLQGILSTPAPGPTVLVAGSSATYSGGGNRGQQGLGAPPLVEARTNTLVNNSAGLSKARLQATTPGTMDPWTGQDLSKNGNPGSGLPGGRDISKLFPSGDGRLNGVFGGGSGNFGEGTAFGSKPGSDPAGDFLNQHADNIPDPLAASGKGISGLSPADDGPDDSLANDAKSSSADDTSKGSSADDTNGKGTVAVGEITVVHGDFSMICGSDVSSPNDFPKQGGADECVVIQHDDQGNFKSEGDRQAAENFVTPWYPEPENGNNGNKDFEGEDGDTGGCGHSANDLHVGSTGRMAGKVVGGTDPGEPGLGQDAAHKMPATLEAIGKYVAQGGKVYGGRAGYQGGDSGHGQDIGGAMERIVSVLQKAIDGQRFNIDPNAPCADQTPWWIQPFVSPAAKSE